MMMIEKLFHGIVPIPDEMRSDIAIAGLAHDSRKVESNYLFVAISGYQSDGHEFIQQAVNNGAKAVVAERKMNFTSVPVFVVKNSRKILAELAHRFYQQPSNSMRTIGITGTNGKTTVSYLLESIFKISGESVGVIGTLEYRWKDQNITAARTTPDALELHQLLRRMKDDGVQTVVMEVSSHALAMNRVWGMNFDGAIFTNLSRDHLDFHASFQSYGKAKSLLFGMVKPNGIAIVNCDDPAGQLMLNAACSKTATYGLSNSAVDYKIKPVSSCWNQTRFLLYYNQKSMNITSPLCGDFNTMNTTAAAVTGIELGLDDHVILNGIRSVERIPGRMESLHSSRGFGVVIDYAHTPAALENVLKTVQKLTQGRLIVVFGCGGDRDPGKRVEMGKAAGSIADEIIVTSDNPRSEDPEKIIDDIIKGIPANKRYMKVINRWEAIQKALNMAESEDSVLIAGKGHENYQEIKGERFPFDDRKVVMEYPSIQDER